MSIGSDIRQEISHVFHCTFAYYDKTGEPNKLITYRVFTGHLPIKNRSIPIILSERFLHFNFSNSIPIPISIPNQAVFNVMCKMLLLVPRNFVLLRVPNFLNYSLLLYTQGLDIKYSAI